MFFAAPGPEPGRSPIEVAGYSGVITARGPAEMRGHGIRAAYLNRSGACAMETLKLSPTGHSVTAVLYGVSLPSGFLRFLEPMGKK